MICDSQNVGSESRIRPFLHKHRRSNRLIYAKQPSDCMQRDHVVKMSAIVTNVLRTLSHFEAPTRRTRRLKSSNA
jgi:hypothetical protein